MLGDHPPHAHPILAAHRRSHRMDYRWRQTRGTRPPRVLGISNRPRSLLSHGSTASRRTATTRSACPRHHLGLTTQRRQFHHKHNERRLRQFHVVQKPRSTATRPLPTRAAARSARHVLLHDFDETISSECFSLHSLSNSGSRHFSQCSVVSSRSAATRQQARISCSAFSPPAPQEAQQVLTSDDAHVLQ